MSYFEGYTEYLCKEGHYFVDSCYMDTSVERCPECGASIEYAHDVDITSGQDEAAKVKIGHTDIWSVDHYGNKYANKMMFFKPAEGSDWKKIKTHSISATEVKQLKNGIYEITWCDGGTSLAAVGTLHNSNKWFAPINWTGTSEKHIACTDWAMVVSVKLISS